MKDETTKLIERIRKLLSRTPGAGATQAEAETALSLARKLMDQHGLDAETVASHAGADNDWTVGDAWETAGIVTAPEAIFLGAILSQFFHVKAFRERKGPPDFGVMIRLFGEKHRVEVARWVYVYLAGIYSDLWVAHRVATKCRKDRQKAYYQGLTWSIAKRLKDERAGEEVAASEGNGTALVKLDDRLAKAFEAAYPELPTARTPRYRDRSSMQAGIKDGEGINIARPVAKVGPRGIGGPTS